MNTKPLKSIERRSIERLQNELNKTRQRLRINAPGVVLFRTDLSYADEEVLYVEADGLGGAVLRVVEGNYPVDYCTREEKTFSTEAEAVQAASNWVTN